MDEGNASGSGLKDHLRPLVGSSVIASPFGFFQCREETRDCPKEGDENQGVGGTDVHGRWTPRPEAARICHPGWRRFLLVDREVHKEPLDHYRA